MFKFPVSFGCFFILAALFAPSAQAIEIAVDPGVVGNEASPFSFTLDDAATVVDITFTDMKTLEGNGLASFSLQVGGGAPFIDFTGYTCTNCRYMEGSVFQRPEVRSRLEKMVLVTAYTDCAKEICERQRDYQIKRFDTAALPFYVIINPHDDTGLAKHPDMTKDIKAYVAFLDSGLAAFEKVKPKTAEEAPVASAYKDVPVELAASGKKVDFEFSTLEDGKKKIKLSSLRGHWVFVNFWASWCAPCKKELVEDLPFP